MSQAAALRWYAVHTQPRAEWLAHTSLRRAGYATLYLHYRGTVRHANRVLVVLKPYYPRYLFAGLEPGQGLYAASKAEGVSGVVNAGDAPLELPADVIEREAAKGNADGLVALSVPEQLRRERLAKGAEQRILSGSFAGFVATVEVDNGSELVAWVEAFNRRVRAVLPESALFNPIGGAL